MPDHAPRTAPKGIARIPLTITATATGQSTEDVLVAVMASDLDALEAKVERLALALIEAQNPGIDMERVRRERQ